MACQCTRIASLQGDLNKCHLALEHLHRALHYAETVEMECRSLGKFTNVTLLTSDDEGLYDGITDLSRPSISIINEAIGKVNNRTGQLSDELAALRAEDSNWDHEKNQAK